MGPVRMYGGIEAGGTKFNCIVARDPAQVLAEATYPTLTPSETLSEVIQFFRPFSQTHQIGAIGIGSFGPCDLSSASPTYGYITSTPKPGWQDVDLVGSLRSALQVEVAFDTDVNAAALGEYRWGATSGTATSLYLTIGTGIGGGMIIDGKPLHGLQHPEMGHIRIPHDRDRDPFPGACPYHGDCFEGLASGPALQARFGRRGEDLPDDEPFWDLESEYIATALTTYILVGSPQRIVVGGGILQRSFLFARIRRHVVRLLGGYVRRTAVTDDIANFIVSPALGPRSGVFGAIALAAAAADKN